MPATPFLAVCFPNMKHSYPIEATEGFGTRLSVIASTFEILN